MHVLEERARAKSGRGQGALHQALPRRQRCRVRDLEPFHGTVWLLHRGRFGLCGGHTALVVSEWNCSLCSTQSGHCSPPGLPWSGSLRSVGRRSYIKALDLGWVSVATLMGLGPALQKQGPGSSRPGCVGTAPVGPAGGFLGRGLPHAWASLFCTDVAATYHASWGLDCRSTLSGILSSPRNSSPNLRLLAFQRSTLRERSGFQPSPEQGSLGRARRLPPRGLQQRPPAPSHAAKTNTTTASRGRLRAGACFSRAAGIKARHAMNRGLGAQAQDSAAPGLVAGAPAGITACRGAERVRGVCAPPRSSPRPRASVLHAQGPVGPRLHPSPGLGQSVGSARQVQKWQPQDPELRSCLCPLLTPAGESRGWHPCPGRCCGQACMELALRHCARGGQPSTAGTSRALSWENAWCSLGVRAKNCV